MENMEKKSRTNELKVVVVKSLDESQKKIRIVEIERIVQLIYE